MKMLTFLISPFLAVREFQEKFQLPVAAQPGFIPCAPHDDLRASFALDYIRGAERSLRNLRESYPDDQLYGRVQMMIEELREFIEAVQSNNLAAAADSLVDLEYFVLGTSVMMGLPHDDIFAEVHRANMDKELVASAEESRRLNKLDVKKPEGWTPPDVQGILDAVAGAA